MGDVTLSSSSASALLKILGLCGSSFAGERANAAQKADNLIRSLGLTWGDVIRMPPHHGQHDRIHHDHHRHDRVHWRSILDFCLHYAEHLNQREYQFIHNLNNWNGNLTEKQHAWLVAIYQRVQRMER